MIRPATAADVPIEFETTGELSDEAIEALAVLLIDLTERENDERS